MVSPENTFELRALVSTTEATLGTVPADKNARKAFNILLNEQSGTTNGIHIRQYSGDTADWDVYLNIGAYDTLDLTHHLESPVLTFKPGTDIKAVADAASVQVVLGYYDL